MMASAPLSSRLIGTLATLLLCTTLHADPARFDLAGPKVDVHVTRDGRTLPIAQVPNLLPGDKLWLRADLPPTQSVHYLLVAAFLRGTTNPPPDNWFYNIQTWNKKVREEGVTITVPDEAQQVILFLAPETGGDFSTLRSAVRGRPGIFVRASQDLLEAGFEQARIETYLANIRRVPPDNAKALAEHSDMLSRTLNLKPNGDCFKKPVDAQATCLTQAGTQSLLDDGHGTTVAAALSNGPGSDLINQASYTAMAGAGLYSAYVGAIVDLVRLMSGLHTAKYQYIPAIAFPTGDALNLRLNTPPSFHDPKSVIVIGLPAIQAAVPPPLRPADPTAISCLLKPAVTLPVEGAPLVFSTAYAHDLVLHLEGPGPGTDIPLTADAYQGGLVLARVPDRKPLSLDVADETTPQPAGGHPVVTPPSNPHTPVPGTNAITGVVKGYWGFDTFTGPVLNLQDIPGKDWKVVTGDTLIAGQENHLSLTSTGTACIEKITVDAAGKPVETQWKPENRPASVEVSASLKSVDPGALHLSIHQYGDPTPEHRRHQNLLRASHPQISRPPRRRHLRQTHRNQSRSGPATHPGQSRLHPGSRYHDATATTADPAPSINSLRLTLPPDTPAPKLRPGEHLTASFSLKDGRTLTLPVTVAPQRPSVTLLSKTIVQSGNSSIHLADQDDLPVNEQLVFSLKSADPFPRTGKLEIANADETLHTTLTVASGNLILQNPHTLLVTLDPLSAFGTSAFGPLRLRAVAPDGTAGDWLPLVTLVRLPTLKDLRCPPDATQPCILSGSALYLIDSVATDPSFADPTAVPEGFVGDTLTLPHPSNPKTGFYLRLRDDPNATNSVTLPILPQTPITTSQTTPTKP